MAGPSTYQGRRMVASMPLARMAASARARAAW